MGKIKIGFIVLISLALVGLVVAGVVMANSPLKANNNNGEKEEYVSDEVIVKFKGDKEPFRVMKVPTGKVKEKVKEYKKRADVVYAEPNYLAYSQWVPNDPYYSYQWHLDNPVYGGIQMEEAWEFLGAPGTPGGGVTVAIVDTGIAYENYGRYCQAPDLAQTSFVAGYDFVNNDSHPNDDNRHGTHVAGTVAQSTNNGIGVAGVAFNTSLMPVKVLDSRGSGTYANVASGIRFAADNGAKVINLSLGGTADSQTLKDAVAYAYGKGVTVVAACGNSNVNTCLYPAAYDNYVIAVGATQYDETKAPYSNYGPSLDLVAPGGNTGVDQNGDGYGDGILQQTFASRMYCSFAYYFFQGTSMATPHVSGVAALLIANGNADANRDGITSPDELRTALQETAEDKGDAGWDEIYGWGLVDAFAALSWTPAPVDSPPTVKITSPLDGVTVSGTIDITADATDDIGVAQVDFYVGNTLIGTATTSPYSVSWDSTTVTDGTYTLTAVAIDTTSQTASDSISVLIDNVNDPPVANAGPDQSAYVNEPVYFDGSGSTDDRGIVSYVWDFGDETTASGITVEHIYTAEGEYTITLNITDNGGLTGQDTAIVTVSTVPVAETMHVGDIAISGSCISRRSWVWCKATATVLILDSSNLGVEGATVSGSWSGVYSANVSGTTGTDGKVTFKTSLVKGGGIFTFNVNDITKERWIYDSAANVETSDSITLP